MFLVNKYTNNSKKIIAMYKNGFIFGMVSVVVGTLCLLTSCTSDAVPDAGENGNAYVPVELTAEEAYVAERMNNFAIDLLTEAITANDNSENIAISPLGAVMVAGMFGNAINPSDRGELLDALGINDMGLSIHIVAKCFRSCLYMTIRLTWLLPTERGLTGMMWL